MERACPAPDIIYMLLGTYQIKVASGHRVAVPAQLRKDLGEIYILAKWYEECLVLVGKGSFEALLTRIIGKESLITAPVRGSEHFIFSSAYEVVPDDQGRVIIPESLVTYADLEEDIYFLGVGDRVEIWNKNAWEAKEKNIVRDSARYIEELALRK